MKGIIPAASAAVLFASACGSGSDPAEIDGAVDSVVADSGGVSEDGMECGPGRTLCGGSCVDTRQHNDHCGDCDIQCDTASGQACVQGMCVCGGGLTECNDRCVDISTDSSNCGQCGNDCGDPKYWCGEQPTDPVLCQGGECVLPCPVDQCMCDGSCVDTSASNDHCGGCDTACDTATGFVCVQGECQCPDGTTECNNQCVNTDSDNDHCGKCDNECDPSETCSNGNCGSTCGSLTYCGGACVDTSSDQDHCGSCFYQCLGDQVCVESVCQCPEENPDDCGTTCVNFQTDNENCGDCDKECAEGEMCAGGFCESSCGDLTYCGGVCVDLETDEGNCNICGHACAPGETCIGGVCESPCGSLKDCGGACVDPLTDANHCGFCDNQCASDESCTSGFCTKAALVDFAITCDSMKVSPGGTTQCHAQGTLENGNTIDLTDDQSTVWMVEDIGFCEDVATIDHDGKKGLLRVIDSELLVGCLTVVSASYYGFGTFASNEVYIQVVSKTLTGIFIKPQDPVVPYLKCQNCCNLGAGADNYALQIAFEVWGQYDSGQQQELTAADCQANWISTNAYVASVSPSGNRALASLVNAPLTSGQTTDILVFCGSNSATSTLTVEPPPDAMTSLVLEPASSSLPVGKIIGFSAMINHGAAVIDVTEIARGDGHYSGWPAVEFSLGSGTTNFLSDASHGFNPSTGQYEYMAVGSTSGSVEKVNTRFCIGNGFLFADADVEVTTAELVGCVVVRDDQLSGWTYDPWPDPVFPQPRQYAQPKGQVSQQFRALGFYSNVQPGDQLGHSSIVDITDAVTWSSSAADVVLVHDAAGDQGKADMLELGMAVLEADPSAIRAGVPACTARINVLDGTVCKVTVMPSHRGMVYEINTSVSPAVKNGRRWWRRFNTLTWSEADEHDGSSEPEPLLPNEANWQQQYVALVDVDPDPLDPCCDPSQTSCTFQGVCSVDAHCPPGYECQATLCQKVYYPFAMDMTAEASWNALPTNITNPPALTPTGTKGLFATLPDPSYPLRTDMVSATVATAPSSTATVQGFLNTRVCGTRLDGTVRMVNRFSYDEQLQDFTATTPYGQVKTDDIVQYSMVMGFADQSLVPMACHPMLSAADGYLLDVTEEATGWSASNPDIVQVSGTSPTKGQITGKQVGITFINASFNLESSDLPVAVISP